MSGNDDSDGDVDRFRDGCEHSDTEPVVDETLTESEHSVAITLTFSSYGSRENVERAIEEVHRWISVQMHRNVQVAASGYTDGKSLVTKNGSLSIVEIIG